MTEKQNFSSFQPQNDIHLKNSTPNYTITEIKELQNENLKNYLHQRGLSANIYPFVKEVHFKIGEKNLYAVGFENLSGGWELRNSFYKGSLLKKDIAIMDFNRQKEDKSVVVFEGFTDALSFIEMQKAYRGDLLVMNSISLLNKTKNHLQNYSDINLFLDNDKAGETCKNSILKSFSEAKDHSGIYAPHKDLNDYLLSKIQTKIESRLQNELKSNQKHQENEINPTNQTYRRKR